MVEIEELLIHHSKSGKLITSVYSLKGSSTIQDVKKQIQIQKPKFKAARQEIRLDQKSRGLRDEETLKNLKLKTGDKLYVKDLGLQIGWSTVFFVEYAGPLILYLWMSTRPWIFYGDSSVVSKPFSTSAK